MIFQVMQEPWSLKHILKRQRKTLTWIIRWIIRLSNVEYKCFDFALNEYADKRKQMRTNTNINFDLVLLSLNAEMYFE
jgi:hypothetical protein